MTRVDLEKLAHIASNQADSDQDAALAQADQIEGVLRKSSNPPADVQMIHTAKAERRMRERMQQEDQDFEDDDSLSPAEKRALDAEKRAAWRKARLKSLENVMQ